MYGLLRDAYTLRKLWGSFFRPFVPPGTSQTYGTKNATGLGRFVANKVLRFPHGANLSSYTQLYVVFFLSGLLHLVGEPTSERRMVYRSLRFFPLHAVGIASGDLFIYITKRLLFVGRIKFNPGQAGES